MVPARREMKQSFGHSIPTARIAGYQEPADFLGPYGSARLAGGEHVPPLPRQGRHEEAHLGAFAGSLAAFEGYEAPACHRSATRV